MFNKKAISCLSLATLCIATPLSVSALEVGYENKDFRYENPTPIQEYAIERGIYTDRFLFFNGNSYPHNSEEYSGEDMRYIDYLKTASNIQLARGPWDYYHQNVKNGRCLGMSLTSILAHNGVFSPSDIQEGKNRLIDITFENYTNITGSTNDPVYIKIIPYQLRQDRPDFWLYMHHNFSEYNKSEAIDNLIETAQKAHDEGKYFLIVFDDNTNNADFIHAVTGMGIIDGEWEYAGEKYDKCIPIYDTNLLHRCEDDTTISYGCSDDLSLFINSETKKIYHPSYFEDDGTKEESFKIFTLDNEDFMNYKGKINPSESYDNIDVSGISAISIRSSPKDYNGNKTDGKYTLNVTKEDGTTFDGISACKRIFANKGNEYVFKGKNFKVQNTGNSREFGGQFMDINHIVLTDFDGAVNNMFYNADEFNFDVSAPTDYNVSMAFEEDSYGFAPHYKFDFSGNTESDFKAVQTDRGIILSSSDNVTCQIKVNDVIRDEQGLVSLVYTDYAVNPETVVQEEAISTLNDVLLTFDENGSLAYYIGDNYDTEVQKGDVNCDGFIDAVDASQILIAYAANSTDSTPYVGKTLGDYNDDGLVDAVDSSQVLIKYAELSTDNKKQLLN